MTAWANGLRPTGFTADNPVLRASPCRRQPSSRVWARSSAIFGCSRRAGHDGRGDAVHLRITLLFPGLAGTIDREPVPIRARGPNGLIGLDVPAGEHDVQVFSD